MSKPIEIGMKVDSSSVDSAVTSLDRLTAAAERAQVALENLASAVQGNVQIHMVGDLVSVEITTPQD